MLILEFLKDMASVYYQKETGSGAGKDRTYYVVVYREGSVNAV